MCFASSVSTTVQIFVDNELAIQERTELSNEGFLTIKQKMGKYEVYLFWKYEVYHYY